MTQRTFCLPLHFYGRISLAEGRPAEIGIRRLALVLTHFGKTGKASPEGRARSPLFMRPRFFACRRPKRDKDVTDGATARDVSVRYLPLPRRAGFAGVVSRRMIRCGLASSNEALGKHDDSIDLASIAPS